MGCLKTGKSRLSGALPWGEEGWGDEAIYLAWDSGSESLSSMRPEDRPHLHVYVPSLKKRRTPDGDEFTLDAHDEANKMASKDWLKEHPKVGSIIWDTATETARKMLAGYANTGAFSGGSGDKHITVGTKGENGYMALPLPGDYGMAQMAMAQLMDVLFTQPLNVIVICHADIGNPNPEVSDVTFGGPATVGQKGISIIAGKFDNLFRTDIRPAKAPAKGNEYKIYTDRKGIWLGGMRTGDKRNPLPEFVFGRSEGEDINPTDFWRKVREIQYGKAA